MDKKDCQWASNLNNYLELDSWNIKDGLLILAGISPAGADIIWDGYKNYLNVIIDTPNIINAHIFGEETDFYNIPFYVYDVHDCTKEDLETIKAKIETLNEAENRLKRIKRLWDNSQKTDERYPVEYFITWAKNKGISVTDELSEFVLKTQVKADSADNIQKQPDHNKDGTDDQLEPTINVETKSAVSMKDEMQNDKEMLAKKWKEEGKTFIQMKLSEELAKYEKYNHIEPATIEKLTRKA